MRGRYSISAENPYAPPKSFFVDSARLSIENIQRVALWREGDIIVTLKDAKWPDRCVVCNTPTHGVRIRRRFSWHHPAFYLFIFLNIIVYLVAGLIARKTCTVMLGMCHTHRRRRIVGLCVGWAGFIISFVSVPIGLSVPSDWGYALGVGGGIGLFTFPLIGLLLSSFVLVKRIDANSMRIKVGRRFLESIPVLPDG